MNRNRPLGRIYVSNERQHKEECAHQLSNSPINYHSLAEWISVVVKCQKFCTQHRKTEEIGLLDWLERFSFNIINKSEKNMIFFSSTH